MNSRILTIAGSLLTLASWQASAQGLAVGSDAPPLTVERFLKGEVVERLEPDRIYVVDFWATWCVPCVASIPHLTELREKYKDKGIQFIGVDVFERDPSKVQPFVDAMGGKMGYSVAVDAIPKGEDASGGRMATAWMKAAETDDLPTAFVVKNGKIAWIGHPMKLDAPLEKIASPDFDLARAARLALEEKASRQKLMAVIRKINNLGDDATDKNRLALIDKAIDEDPDFEKTLGLPKYIMMLKARDGAASAYGTRLVEKVYADDALALNNIAWANVGPDARDDGGKPDVKLGLKAATRANELSKGESGPVLDTLAKAYFDNGDPRRALDCQEKAIKLSPEDGDEMIQRLEQYRRAIEAGKKP